MGKLTEIKKQILTKLNETIDHKINDIKSSMEQVKESRDSETKSSAGDKYETGRAMAQIELDKYQDQLDMAVKMKKALTQIEPKKKGVRIEFGSLVISNQGNYFISVGLGVIEVNGEKYFAISLASPIGQLCEGKSAGDTFVFRDKTFTITEIV